MRNSKPRNRTPAIAESSSFPASQMIRALTIMSELKNVSASTVLRNLGVTERHASAPQQAALTRTEIADYLSRAGFDADKACELAAAERAVDFGDSCTWKDLDDLAEILSSVPEVERASLQLLTVELVARWLLRKGRAVGPDGNIVVGVRTLEEAQKIVSGWVNEIAVRRRTGKAQNLAGTSTPTKSHVGRPQRLTSDFVLFAGTLWLKAKRRHTGLRKAKVLQKVTDAELLAIALSLDKKDYVPPSNYLEKHAADELRTYNSRNSNSKTGAIKTWSQLVSLGDKNHLRGMRRLLSRCARKSAPSSHALSGN
jgi:hypothetical protein